MRCLEVYGVEWVAIMVGFTHFFGAWIGSKILWKLSFREGGIEAKYSVIASRQQLDCDHPLYLSHNGTYGGPFSFCQN